MVVHNIGGYLATSILGATQTVHHLQPNQLSDLCFILSYLLLAKAENKASVVELTISVMASNENASFVPIPGCPGILCSTVPDSPGSPLKPAL